VKEFQVSFEKSLIDPILAGADHVIEHLESGEVPPRPVSATSKSCNTCRFCNYKTMCWSAT
jgi:CRISPR/Cas system-associated exonuclease Cas4 (RecB family)